MLAVFALVLSFTKPLASRSYREGFKLLIAIGMRLAIPMIILGLWLPDVVSEAVQQSVPTAALSDVLNSDRQFSQGTLCPSATSHPAWCASSGT